MRDPLASVLVFRIGELGDALVSLPALHRIKRSHPQARMTLMTDSHPGKGWVSSWDVLQAAGIFSEVLFYQPPSRWKDLAALPRLARKIREMKPDRLYYLAPSPRSIRQVRRDRFFFQVLCGIKDIRGMAASDGWVGRRDEGGAVVLPSESERLLRAAGPPCAGETFDVPVGEREKRKIDELWKAFGLPLPSHGRVVALGPGAKKSASRWPRERYEALARRLSEAFADIRFLIVGGREESEIEWAVNWAGALTVWESAEALRRCALFVGNNSGAMHLAALMKTRCVAVSSARDHPGIWDPQGAGHVVLRKNVPCSGCLLSDCREKELICLTSITVDEVFEACSSVLNE